MFPHLVVKTCLQKCCDIAVLRDQLYACKIDFWEPYDIKKCKNNIETKVSCDAEHTRIHRVLIIIEIRLC